MEKMNSSVVKDGQDQKNVGHGDCDGPKSMYVKLISSDGHEFIIKRDYAFISGTIKAMLSGPGLFPENKCNEIRFHDIPSHVLHKVCLYLAYKAKFSDTSAEFPDFPISQNIALQLAFAAYFLDC